MDDGDKNERRRRCRDQNRYRICMLHLTAMLGFMGSRSAGSPRPSSSSRTHPDPIHRPAACLLADMVDCKESRDLVDTISACAEITLSIINDILDFSKIGGYFCGSCVQTSTLCIDHRNHDCKFAAGGRTAT